MGKKNKSTKLTNSNNPTVSLVTITQLKRFECIKILIDLISAQTYSNIIEWVIVEGTRIESEAKINEINIESLISNSKLKFPIVYVRPESNTKLGQLRNIGNQKCQGDITVCMDDDDFYPSNRVEHVVKKLSDSKYNIAGCSDNIMYDYNVNKLYQFIGYGNFHSINTCMGWKKEYLLTNSHDPNIDFGEEESFTKKFTEPMVQLDPKSTVILSSHNFNTFNKKELLIYYHMGKNKKLVEIYSPIDKYIEKSILTRYKNIFVSDTPVKYDIVYFCGGFSIGWDPSDKKLGGSEQAVVHLSENWVRLGKTVAVYGMVPNKQSNGVDYFNWKQFEYDRQYNILILWRIFGLICAGPFPIKANKIWLDIHDNFTSVDYPIELKKYANKYDKIFLKSNYHKECFMKLVDPNFFESNIAIIPNGIRINDFSVNKYNEQRNPYRFCYCSCYTRGLQLILEQIWPVIYNYEPRSELHVYYGMDGIKDENYKNVLKKLLSSPGVMDHGRQPVEMICREKYLSNFHLYISETKAEIDCISIRESLVTGCIPLLSDFGVFKERDGFHFNISSDKYISFATVQIISFLKNLQNLDIVREQNKLSKTILGWDEVSSLWLEN